MKIHQSNNVSLQFFIAETLFEAHCGDPKRFLFLFVCLFCDNYRKNSPIRLIFSRYVGVVPRILVHSSKNIEHFLLKS